MVPSRFLAALTVVSLLVACGTKGPSLPTEVPATQVGSTGEGVGTVHAQSVCTAYLPTWYSQHNPSWSSILLGNSSTDTIGNYGCVITDLAMLYTAWGVPTTPSQLNTSAKNGGCFGPGSSLVNVSCAINSRGGPHAVWDISMSDTATEICSGHPVMVDVTWGGGHKMLVNYYNGGSTTSMSSYSVVDPWDGTSKSLSSYSATRWRKIR